MLSHLRLPVSRGCLVGYGTSKLLPPEARQGAILLQVPFPEKDRHLELHRSHPAELLPQCTIRSKLEL